MNPIQQLLNSTVVPPEVLRAARAISIMKRWEQAVGKEMAERSWPERYDHGTVWVAVVGSVWAQELRMQKEEIVARLNQLAGEPGLFVNLRFGVRPINRLALGPAAEADVAESGGLSIREIAQRRLKEWPNAEGTEG